MYPKFGFKPVQNAIIQTSDADCNEAGHRDRLAACLRGWSHVNPDPHALAWISWHPCRIFLTVIHVDYVIAINALLFVSLVIGLSTAHWLSVLRRDIATRFGSRHFAADRGPGQCAE